MQLNHTMKICTTAKEIKLKLNTAKERLIAKYKYLEWYPMKMNGKLIFFHLVA